MSTSTKTGEAPTYLITFHEAAKVVAGQITSSSGPVPVANKDKCKALVPELQLIVVFLKNYIYFLINFQKYILINQCTLII